MAAYDKFQVNIFSFNNFEVQHVDGLSKLTYGMVFYAFEIYFNKLLLYNTHGAM